MRFKNVDGIGCFWILEEKEVGQDLFFLKNGQKEKEKVLVFVGLYEYGERCGFIVNKRWDQGKKLRKYKRKKIKILLFRGNFL